MDENIKQVRVDNWGIFFLQRLQIFFNKTDFCDLTLQFEGNVQLKVHKLVMNACTEYFQVLEQTCEMFGEILVMPADLQADVVLPIVNFMYTGMLEFHISIYEKLYRAANVMSMTVLTKLLDAQKTPLEASFRSYKKSLAPPVTWNTQSKKKLSRVESNLPSTLPSRKFPAWKRKNVSSPSKIASHFFTEQKRQAIPIDPLAFEDNGPKPTRFEWPEEELPVFNSFDPDFNELSYTSKPLFIQNTESRPSTSFDPTKIRIDMTEEDDDEDDLEDNGEQCSHEEIKKRKGNCESAPAKRPCANTNDKENEATSSVKVNISLSTKSPSLDVEHAKILSEVFKKYPNLVKKNKKISVKILAKGNESSLEKVPALKSPQLPQDAQEERGEDGTWLCRQCSTSAEPVEFALYYLYRKHMADVHFQKCDSRMCKFCGHKSSKHILLMYHQYLRHGIKPSLGYNFPKCSHCPYIALNELFLGKHEAKHSKMELQCLDCNITYANQQALFNHTQISGHTGKSAKPLYNCQYCSNKCQSSSSLFVHFKHRHRKEARRDGIVSIDEAIEEEQYKASRPLSDYKPEKIKILSDVKLAAIAVQPALQPSSEAEALNNVANGIATSLGLVDVVVLDESQQYILHTDTQQSITAGTSEFLIPSLQESQTFTETQEVITSEGNATILHNANIRSTDELVMVLTEQDYNNEQNDSLDADHSNIVVLYSHPVDCADTQFLSSGNIVLTSQSNIIELSTDNLVAANTSNYVTASNQITLPTQLESIELIEKEVNGHLNEIGISKDNQKTVMQEKQILIETMDVEILSDKDIKENENVNVVIEQQQASSSKDDCSVPIADELKESVDHDVSHLDEKDNENATTVDANASSPGSGEQITLHLSSTVSENGSEHSEDMQVENNKEVELNVSASTENTIHDTEEQNYKNTLQDIEEQNNKNTIEDTEEQNNTSSGEPVSETGHSPVDEEKDIQEDAQEIKNDEEVKLEASSASDSNDPKEKEGLTSKENTESEDVTSPDNCQLEEKHDLGEHEPASVPEHTPESLDNISKPTIADLDTSVDILPSQPDTKETENILVSCSENTSDQIETSEESVEINPSSETTDENQLIPHQSAESSTRKRKMHGKKRKNVKKLKNAVTRKAAKSILDEWDDADSQQSGFKNGANVDKLIDDWDDDEEEGRK